MRERERLYYVIKEYNKKTLLHLYKSQIFFFLLLVQQSLTPALDETMRIHQEERVDSRQCIAMAAAILISITKATIVSTR